MQVTITRASDGETLRQYPMHSQILELHFRSQLAAGPKKGVVSTTDCLSINLGQSLLIMQVKKHPSLFTLRCRMCSCRDMMFEWSCRTDT